MTILVFASVAFYQGAVWARLLAMNKAREVSATVYAEGMLKQLASSIEDSSQANLLTNADRVVPLKYLPAFDQDDGVTYPGVWFVDKMPGTDSRFLTQKWTYEDTTATPIEIPVIATTDEDEAGSNLGGAGIKRQTLPMHVRFTVNAWDVSATDAEAGQYHEVRLDYQYQLAGHEDKYSPVNTLSTVITFSETNTQ